MKSLGGNGNIAASYDAASQNANISATALIALPVQGLYRITGEIICKQAATTSSTLPGVTLTYTDFDTNAAGSIPLASTNTANAVGSATRFENNFYAKAGQAIQISSSGYASSGTTQMLYSLRARIEYLG
jgi:hypothetical protein